ncbi:uncharacterized protein LOC128266433 isoform X2 [Drosophila gunungcola]|uniref:uncharacterized protein LOC128266433 isoform X2 n=1 Tax=Drosophila gunungcola TaxID=103775 RepID=UPI0022E32D2A|nr:uncharacterized protein LOC128266433 isoform X2 [Drosophila gunungcola]
MQLLAVILVLILASLAHCRPTFDKIADVLLGVLDDRPAGYFQAGGGYPHPGYPRPHPGPGPLIQEGYEHGYDYHYGGGYEHGGYQQQAPPPGYGYYPPPQRVPPPNAYYPSPDHYSHYNHHPPPTSPPHGYYPHTVHKTQDLYGGGYKQRGY